MVMTSRRRAEERVRRQAAIERGHQPAAEQRGDDAEEGQDRHRDDQRQQPRHDQHFGGIETHGAQRVDLLAHLHRAELGGVGAAGAAGDHDRDDQHAELAQGQHAEHVDHEDAGAEFGEMEDALLRDDAADQEGDHHDDRDRLPAHLLQVMHQRGKAEMARMAEDLVAGIDDRAGHLGEALQDRPEARDRAADPLQHDHHTQRRAIDPIGLLDPADLGDQRRIGVRQPHHLRLAAGRSVAAPHALDEPGAECIKLGHPRDVDQDAAAAGRELLGLVDHLLQIGGMMRRPRATGPKRDAVRINDLLKCRSAAHAACLDPCLAVPTRHRTRTTVPAWRGL